VVDACFAWVGVGVPAAFVEAFEGVGGGGGLGGVGGGHGW
jgi:hypothetical protein